MCHVQNVSHDKTEKRWVEEMSNIDIGDLLWDRNLMILVQLYFGSLINCMSTYQNP